MSEPTLIERLQHFEDHSKEAGDGYGAEVLYRARERITQLKEENAALKLENKRYSGALYDAMCLQVDHDDDIFSDIRLDHLMGVALLTKEQDDERTNLD